MLVKDADGDVEAIELSDLDEGELGALRPRGRAGELLSEETCRIAAAIEPGSAAGVLIWENIWAAPFASAARHSGGQLVASGRIPIQAIIAAVEADDAEPGGD